ncbi:hypothetical protein OSB04_020044 [Centaurea solstitialis]|uniref:Uncharacterized protein n=1 Tax=Centaurea solstitialis TaxID=347529 RepID=A0AA38T4W4_9ASTR|nr:hypothetical protein OSB04_020044 [Centaurea solstitialis]
MVNHNREDYYSEDGDRDYIDLDSERSESSFSEVLPYPYLDLENQFKDLASKVSKYDNKIKKANNLNASVESKLASEQTLLIKFLTSVRYDRGSEDSTSMKINYFCKTLVPRVPATTIIEEIPEYYKPKPVTYEKELASLTPKCKRLLIMALPNEIFESFDHCSCRTSFVVKMIFRSSCAGFPNRKTRAENSVQIFRIENCTILRIGKHLFSESEISFSESENRPLIWGFAPESIIFRTKCAFSELCLFRIGKQHFPNRKRVFSASPILSQIRFGKLQFPDRISPLRAGTLAKLFPESDT